MRLIVLFVMLILLVSFVSGELIINCESDDSCNLFSEDSWCEESICVSEEIEENLEVRDNLRDYNEVEWGVLVLEEKEEVSCKDCLSFAPEFSGDFLIDLFSWLFYAK
ncbi:hypothetical protein HN681_03970 [archaeon]|jgi:hypothetical protein|nr:hypothetical protein [archaeon]MBT3730454.1 hypothetical protein [archaeon]MBT4670437.1 hypothetical protein [archaeon]MBT5030098.1 hypothetical protein [archaeon]MBT5288211.1 hypothetical protein [archaeon]